MALFTGRLNQNEIYAAMYNAILSVEVVGKNISQTSSKLVDSARIEAGKEGDKKIFVDTDANFPHDWQGDLEASNLLSVNRDKSPKEQEIVIDVFKQIDRTIDDYLTARIGSMGYAQINSVLVNWLRDTKNIYDSTTYNAYVGTVVSEANRNTFEIDLATPTEGLNSIEKAQMTALTIAEELANLSVDLEDVTRDFNDYKYLRSTGSGDYKIVWNASYVNKINKVSLPTIFHKDGVMDKFNEYVLPKRFFGTVNAEGGTVDGSKEIRALIAKVYTVSEKTYSLFAGDKLPIGATYEANETYTVDNKIIAKVMHNQAIPFMSGFEVSTSFFNPRALNENKYLTWGHNTLQYRYGLPLVVVREKTQ